MRTLSPDQNMQELLQLKAWIAQKMQEIEDDGIGWSDTEVARVVAFWQEFRPKMWANLQKLNLGEKLAQVRWWMASEEAIKLMNQGYDRPDAWLIAGKEWLMMVPEDEEEENIPLRKRELESLNSDELEELLSEAVTDKDEDLIARLNNLALERMGMSGL